MYSTSPLKGVCNVVKYWDADQNLMSLSKVSQAAGALLHCTCTCIILCSLQFCLGVYSPTLYIQKSILKYNCTSPMPLPHFTHVNEITY